MRLSTTFTEPPDGLNTASGIYPIPYECPGGFHLPELSDEEIQELLEEHKSIPHDYVKLLRPVKKSNQQYSQSELTVTGEMGSEFKVSIRKNLIDPLDFSIILMYIPRDEGRAFVLRRYNGKHLHRNKIEGNELHDYHIHLATERYQQAGLKPEGYAEATKDFASVQQGIECLFQDANFVHGSDQRLNGFGED